LRSKEFNFVKKIIIFNWVQCCCKRCTKNRRCWWIWNGYFLHFYKS